MRTLTVATFISTMLLTSAFAKSPMPATGSVSDATIDSAKSNPKRDANNEKHIKDLHAKLKITSSEEVLWMTVAQTMRDNVAQIDKIVDKRESLIGNASAIDDLNAYADVAQAHADSVKKLVTAFAPLYAAMPDAQKKLADEVFMQRAHGHMEMKNK
ncbi:Spy/CpxP family protein refolding chaperone [Undibacterium sp. Ji67W]|uniref:Spy/CpxP family protein refolding chaperone n=1 Tax=Undibacterium sp. Ji67W TaxID=3413042 RepID=UPI003BEF6495